MDETNELYIDKIEKENDFLRKAIKSGYIRNGLKTDNVDYDASDCIKIGLSGGCGINCPLFLGGECEESGEILEHYIEIFRQYDDFYHIEELIEEHETNKS